MYTYSSLIRNDNCIHGHDALVLPHMTTTNNGVKTVAVVDDDELIRVALQRLLKSSGLAVCTFQSAEEFLQSAPLSKLGCLITDIRMPGISGLELQNRLKAQNHDIPIIFITAHGDEKLRIQAMRNGAVAFLAKPFDDDILLDRVRAAIEL